MKINKFIKSLFKKPSMSSNTCNVHIIDDDATDVAPSLGITKKRLNELEVFVKNTYYNDSLNHSESLVEISKFCLHPNELAFACSAYGFLRCLHTIKPKFNVPV